MKQRKKQMWRRLTGLLLTVGMFTNLATGAWAINQPGAEVIDASQKTSETVLSQALQKDLTLTDAEALLALGDYLPDRLLVKVAPGAGIEEDLQTGEVLASQVLLESSDSFAEPGTWLALEVEDYHGLANLMVELGNQEDVLAVEPDYEISLPAEPQLAKSETEKQQTLQQTEALSAGASIDQPYLNGYGIPAGWEFLQKNGMTPGQGVVIAVVDSGVAVNHPDLKNQILRDGSGNVWGKSFVESEPSVEDENGHGTHVAGIIAAENNDFGTTGVAYGAKIMPVKVMSKDGVGSSSNIIAGLKYAAVQGADIINLSLGGGVFSQAETDVLDLLADLGVIVVSAAGNSGAPNEKLANEAEYNQTLYAPYYSVIGVMAEAVAPAENGDRLAAYSNWDVTANNAMEYNLMAPGTNIFSTYLRDGYQIMNGTSMAAPVVSGMAACITGYVNQAGIDGLKQFDKADRYAYVYGQLAGASSYQQGLTYQNKTYDYREANLYEMLTVQPTPQMALLSADELLLQDMVNTLSVQLYHYHGSAKEIAVKAATTVPGVSIQVQPYYNQITDAGTLTLDLKVSGTESLKSGTEIPITLTVTCQNGKNSSDSKTYQLEESWTAYYYQAETLNQTKLANLTNLDKSKLWVIATPLNIPAEQSLTISQGATILFTQNGALQVEGHLRLQGTISDPVSCYTWAESCLLVEEGNGSITAEYAIIENPLLIASQLAHVDLRGDLASASLVQAETMSYCNLSQLIAELHIDSMDHCQLANIIGEFEIKNATNNTIIPLGYPGEEEEVMISTFYAPSYSLDLNKLKPVLAADGTISIALPTDLTAGDETLLTFIQDYVKLLGGSLQTSLSAEAALPEGSRLTISLAVQSQEALTALYQSKVFGNQQEHGFTTEFYQLLQKLNTFRQNAILGAANFASHGMAEETVSSSGRYQLLMDNYWDLEHQELMLYLDQTDADKALQTKYAKPETYFTDEETTHYVFSQLSQAPSDVPPFQTAVRYEPATAAESYLAEVNGAYQVEVEFNTTVENQPVVFAGDVNSFYLYGEEVPGTWTISGGKSIWRGTVYVDNAYLGVNLAGVSWAQDPWMTVEENQRFVFSLQQGFQAEDIKTYANQTTISLKVRPTADDSAGSGVYFYRQDPQNPDRLVQLNQTPAKMITEGENAGWFALEDSTAQPGVLYEYSCRFADDAEDTRVGLAQMALNQPGGADYELNVSALESETLAVFSSLTPDFYDGTEVQTFRLYYDDGLTFQTIEKSENNQHRFLLHYQLGEDAQGNYLDVTIEPAYRMSLGQDALFTAIFSGQGEVQWVDLSANS